MAINNVRSILALVIILIGLIFYMFFFRIINFIFLKYLTAQLQKQFLGKVNIIKFLKQRSKNTVANPLRKTIYHFKKHNNLYFKNWKNKVKMTTTIWRDFEETWSFNHWICKYIWVNFRLRSRERPGPKKCTFWENSNARPMSFINQSQSVECTVEIDYGLSLHYCDR